MNGWACNSVLPEWYRKASSMTKRPASSSLLNLLSRRVRPNLNNNNPLESSIRSITC